MLEAPFVNGIESILSLFSDRTQQVSSEVKELGLMFLQGCADGDGSVSKASQAKTTKSCVKFYLTEGNSTYAMQLKDMLRNILGSGYVYRPKNRNYYLVVASLSPEGAVFLLAHGFFSQRRQMKERLAAKAPDTRYMTRLVRLYSLCGASSFSGVDVARPAPDVTTDFVGMAVVRKHPLPLGGYSRGHSR